MKKYSQIVESMLDAEFEKLYEEALSDPRKLDVLIGMLGEDVANTASAPGLAGVSNGEQPPVSPLQGGFPILRRKKKKRDELMEMSLAIDPRNTTLRETHYNIHGVDDFTLDDAVSLLNHSELEMLENGTKDRIIIRGGNKTITLK